MSSVRTRLADDATKDYEKLKTTLWEAIDQWTAGFLAGQRENETAATP